MIEVKNDQIWLSKVISEGKQKSIFSVLVKDVPIIFKTFLTKKWFW